MGLGKWLTSYGDITISFNNEYLMKSTNGIVNTIATNFNRIGKKSQNLITIAPKCNQSGHILQI